MMQPPLFSAAINKELLNEPTLLQDIATLMDSLKEANETPE